MDYMGMKLSIYESYKNGEMTANAASSIMNSIDAKYGESIAEEAVAVENKFINSSLNVYEGVCDYDTLTEAAKTFGDRVRAIWEKFKKWVKGIIDKIFHRKSKASKGKVQLPKGMMNALKTLKSNLLKLKNAKGVVAIGGAVAAVAGATAIVLKLKKSKNEKNNGVVEEVPQEEVQKVTAEIAQAASDASDKAKEVAPAEPATAKPSTASTSNKKEEKPAETPKAPENKDATPSAIISAVTKAANVADSVSKETASPEKSSDNETTASADNKSSSANKTSDVLLSGRYNQNKQYMDLRSKAKSNFMELTYGMCQSIDELNKYDSAIGKYIHKMARLYRDTLSSDDERMNMHGDTLYQLLNGHNDNDKIVCNLYNKEYEFKFDSVFQRDYYISANAIKFMEDMQSKSGQLYLMGLELDRKGDIILNKLKSLNLEEYDSDEYVEKNTRKLSKILYNIHDIKSPMFVYHKRLSDAFDRMDKIFIKTINTKF